MIKRSLLVVVAVAVGLGTLALLQGESQEGGQGLGPAPDLPATSIQPIRFMHSVHAGRDRIDCQYCHFSAERSVDAGIPPVSTCIGCHQVVGGSTPEYQEEIGLVRQFWNDREAIPWVRVYKVADHVHFPHMRHVAAGVDCTTCHGDVPGIGVIEEVNQPLAMGWCVTCHQERDVRTDCSVCHY